MRAIRGNVCLLLVFGLYLTFTFRTSTTARLKCLWELSTGQNNEIEINLNYIILQVISRKQLTADFRKPRV